ncbi:MAG TPA: hypothetical protein VFC56_06425 [Stellaceae bacterium]|nr:hypothetical protein [Stellaceae bacterium]
MSHVADVIESWFALAEFAETSDNPAIRTKAEQIRLWLDPRVDGDDQTLDRISGLHPGWRSADRIEKRTRLLAQIIACFPSSLTGRPLASEVQAAIAGTNRPPGADGPIRDLQSLGKMPTPEYLRKLLAKFDPVTELAFGLPLPPPRAERWDIAANAMSQTVGDNHRHENKFANTSRPGHRRLSARAAR